MRKFIEEHGDENMPIMRYSIADVDESDGVADLPYRKRRMISRERLPVIECRTRRSERSIA